MTASAVVAAIRDRLERAAAAFERLAERRFDFAAGEGRTALLLTLLLVGHVVVWTLQPALSHNNLADSPDMVENWNWGKEWQWGYYKHPPFFAWVVGAWFHLLPRSDWAYYLLSAVNTAVGLAGIFALTGVVDRDARRRLVAVAALSLTPIYGFLAVKFNANAILLSVWPWAAWAFLRAVKSPRLAEGAVLGLLLAVAMLSKYVSLVLIAAMIAIVLLDRDRLRLLRSPAALAALVVGAVVFAPHVVHMVATRFETLTYAEHMRAGSIGQFLWYLLRLPFSMLLFLAPAIVAVLVALPRPDWSRLAGLLGRRESDDDRRRMIGLVVLPFAAICILGAIEWARLSSQWGFPLFFAASWVLVSAPGIDPARLRLDRVACLVALVWAALVVTAPIVNLAGTLGGSKVYVEPRAELGRAVTRAWHEAAGGARLAVVAGSFEYAHAVGFYSPDDPSVLIEFDWSKSPWLSAAEVAETGVAVVCGRKDDTCEPRARALFGDDLVVRDLAVSRGWFGRRLKSHEFRLLMRLPAPAA